MALTSSYGRCRKVLIGLIRLELRREHHDWDPLQRFKFSHDRIYTFNVSVLGGLSRGPYSDHVTVNPYNGYLTSTNPIVRHAMSLTCTLKRILVNWRAPKHAKI